LSEDKEVTISESEAAAIAEAEAKAAAARLEAAKIAVENAAKKEYEAAAAEAVEVSTDDGFTDKRSSDIIFRRELEEPEFWLDKKGQAPSRPILTADEEQEISRRVEIPSDQTPAYHPEYILSKEFGGTSNYEIGLGGIREETLAKLERLKSDPNSTQKEIDLVEEDLKKLDYLYENFHIGMNVFRTAKGGRDKIKK
jgi:colicin import membrane protein